MKALQAWKSTIPNPYVLEKELQEGFADTWVNEHHASLRPNMPTWSWRAPSSQKSTSTEVMWWLGQEIKTGF